MSFLFFGSRRNRFVLQSEVISLVTSLQPGGLGPRIYIPEAQLHPRALGSLFSAFYHYTGLRRTYSNLAPHGHFFDINSNIIIHLHL
jgi:hypothetical protein